MNGVRRRFLVERYATGITEGQILAGADRLREAVEQMSLEGIDVHHLGTTFVPSEGSVFSLFLGPSMESVEEANRRADIPFHRIVEAIHVDERSTRRGSENRGPGRHRARSVMDDRGAGTESTC